MIFIDYALRTLHGNFCHPMSFTFGCVLWERLVSLFYASFTEVSGLGWNYEKQTQTGSENTAQELPKAIKYGKITLKSPLVPLAAPFEIWVNDCCNSLNMKKCQRSDYCPGYGHYTTKSGQCSGCSLAVFALLSDRMFTQWIGCRKVDLQ